MPIGDVVPGDGDRRHRQLHIDLLGAILVSHVCLRYRERRDQVVERLLWLVGIRWWTRQVVAPLFVDHVVDVDVFHTARLHDVATAQQLKQTHVDAQPSDRREDRRIGPCGRADANVPQVERGAEQVVAKLVGTELNLLTSQQSDDLLCRKASGGWSVNRDERQDGDDAEDAPEGSKTTKAQTLS